MAGTPELSLSVAMCTLGFTLTLLPLVLSQAQLPQEPPFQSSAQNSGGFSQRGGPQNSVIRGHDPSSGSRRPGLQDSRFPNQGNQGQGSQGQGFQRPGFPGGGSQGQGPRGQGFPRPGFPGGGFPGPGYQGYPIFQPGFNYRPQSPGGKEDCSKKTDDDSVEPGNLTCYSCKLDFRNGIYEWDHPCLGRHNDLNVSSTNLVQCGPNDFYCKVERTEVNGILTLLSRECSSKECYIGCRPKGFGISYESCSKCCNYNKCNHVYPISASPPTIHNLAHVHALTLVIYWWCREILSVYFKRPVD